MTKTKPKPKMEMVAVDELHLDPSNSRAHDARNLATIQASLSRFGQQKPIVVNGDGVVIAGNGTLQAARDLGWDTISVVRSSLDGVDANAYAIADNRTAELAEWDFPTLSSSIQSLADKDFDLEVLGFSDTELAPLLAATYEPPAIEEFGDEAVRMASIKCTQEQHETIMRAANKVRHDMEGEKISDGHAVELIASRFLSQ